MDFELSDRFLASVPTLEDVERELAERSLIDFLKMGWRYIDPAPFVPGWHLEAVAEHLEAVAAGEIKHLIINVPPRTSKSSLLSVAFPAWVWAQSGKRIGPLSGPQVQFLSTSYALSLSIGDSTKSRRLISSPWYQRLFGDRFSLAGDQNAKLRYDNDKGGYRLATSLDSALTGEGGNIITIDDPHNSSEVESALKMQSVIDWWDNSLSTRRNNPKTDAFILTMQRLNEGDLSGHVLSKNIGEWTHLCLPMRYEPQRHCVTSIGWEDPREEDGELLCPERFGDIEVKSLERSMGPFQSAGQLQQRPEPKGGGIIKRDWWKLWDEDAAAMLGVEPKAFPPIDYVLASLDTAYGEKQENDYSALTVWGIWTDWNGNRRAMLLNAWKDRLALNPLVEKAAATCKRFRADMLLIEAKASGMSVAQEMRRLYSNEGWSTQLTNPKAMDKVARAYSVQHLFSEGMVYAPERAWSDMVIDECTTFPRGKHDDLVDTVTQGLRKLRDMGLMERPNERLFGEQRAMELKPVSKPLYEA